MFQNIAVEDKNEEDVIEENEQREKIDIKALLKKLFTKQNIMVYIISFMLSTVSTVSGIAPFGLAIFAASLSNGLPAGVVFILTLIGTGIGIRLRCSAYIYFYCSCFYCNGFDFQALV